MSQDINSPGDRLHPYCSRAFSWILPEMSPTMTGSVWGLSSPAAKLCAIESAARPWSTHNQLTVEPTYRMEKSVQRNGGTSESTTRFPGTPIILAMLPELIYSAAYAIFLKLGLLPSNSSYVPCATTRPLLSSTMESQCCTVVSR